MRVLVIDDEPDVLLLCKVNLEVAGHEVLEAADGEEGLRMAHNLHPDLILLDVMLPHRDGIDVLGELSSSAGTRDVPVVLLTAKAQVEDQVRGWNAGASEYVTKPFAPESLAEILTRVRGMTAEEREIRRNEALSSLST
jgi:DNA-binding response OmpR family regulator